jgi:hypothetical protein
VKEPVPIAAVHSQDQHPRTTYSADTPKLAHLPTKPAGELIHQERANQLHNELEEHSQHAA